MTALNAGASVVALGNWRRAELSSELIAGARRNDYTNGERLT
jgi:hypothetical protein